MSTWALGATLRSAVASDGFDGAFLKRGGTGFFLLVVAGLNRDVATAVFIISLKVSRRQFAAEFAIDAGGIDKEFAWCVFGKFEDWVGHEGGS
jgi:hypothetical protein